MIDSDCLGISYNNIRIICMIIDFQVGMAMVTLRHHSYALVKSEKYVIGLAEVQFLISRNQV